MNQKPKNCALCGVEFTPVRRNGKYCSITCKQYSYHNRKNGEIKLPRKFIPQDTRFEIPALIVEDEEQEIESIQITPVKDSVNKHQLMIRKDSVDNINFQCPKLAESISSTKNETLAESKDSVDNQFKIDANKNPSKTN